MAEAQNEIIQVAKAGPAAIDLEKKQIVSDVEYRIAQSWARIMRETSEARAGRPVGNSRSILFEFSDLTDVTKSAVDESWNYVLDICRVGERRPEDLVPLAAHAIGFFSKGVLLYANDRSVAATAFGETDQINAAGAKAVDAVAKHIDVTTREALLGYAAGKAVYPRATWPLTRWGAVKARIGSISVFLLGSVTGAFVTTAVKWLFS
ncbi:hypothetical protein [Aureimonas sp. AU4]|uniref:hypothetical protein n=1 Tax=Aureimonas sp. AU4 TaxID=1638163 RepID=UPI000783A0C0|nr:hypothetical protein [Aureimonas sp. AU4]